MFRLFGRSKNLMVKGGHGWPRPDVAISLNPVYKHRRTISIYDTNL